MDTEYQLDVDIHKMCRLCLTVDEKNLKNFFCSDILDGAIVAFPKIYENVTEIVMIRTFNSTPSLVSSQLSDQLLSELNTTQELDNKCWGLIFYQLSNSLAKKDDKLPQRICTACKTKTSEFHLFKQKCINSNTLLCKILDVPIDITAKQMTKPCQKEIATQSTACEMMTRSSQTIEEEGPSQILEYFENTNEKAAVKVPEMKHEMEQEIDINDITEEGSVGADDYVLDYEYLSPDTYLIGDNCSTVEDNDDTFVDVKNCKIETLDEEKVEELEMLDFTETYVEQPPKPSSSKRTKKSIEVCNICKIELKANNIKSHRNLHQQTLPMILDSIPYFRCGRCKTVFPEVGHMESHFANGTCCSYVDEPACTDYQYLEDFPECDTEEGGPFSGCRILRLSSVMQTADDSFSCQLCYGYSSEHIHDILIHCVQTHFENDEENNVVYYDEVMPGPHRCGVCQLNQPSLSAALRHSFFHLKDFLCPIKDCDDSFSDFKLLSLHIEQKHMAKENTKHQRCMHCGVISESYQAFREHQRKECEKKIYRCDVCEKKFFHKSSLSMHMKYHLAARYSCEVCNKAFSQLCDYKVHFRIHSGEKPYKCEHCDKSFRSISNRKDHMSTHQTVKLFTCEICNQTFKSERTLRGHYPIHNPTKKFQCTQCDKAFHRRFHLTLHLKSHDKKDYRVVTTIPIQS